MDRAEALDRFGDSQVARLATIGPDSTPHIVPVTFSVFDDQVATMVDHKPKTTSRLQRLVNVERAGRAAILADHYSHDWTELWWVRIDGPAAVSTDGRLWRTAREALSAKYPQYRTRPPEGAVISIDIERVRFWASTH